MDQTVDPDQRLLLQLRYLAGYLAEAVAILADGGYRLLDDYRLDLRTGLWHRCPASSSASGPT